MLHLLSRASPNKILFKPEPRKLGSPLPDVQGSRLSVEYTTFEPDNLNDVPGPKSVPVSALKIIAPRQPFEPKFEVNFFFYRF